MDIGFKQDDQLAFARGGVQPKSRMVGSVKLNWDGLTGNSWDAFNQQLLGWGRQVGLGYLFNVMIKLEYKANGYNAVSKYIREFTTHIQFNHTCTERYKWH
jgi:hypothetical protein